jgi:endonuclease III
MIQKLIKDFGTPYSEELGIDLESGKPEEIFKWFFASILFGKRISEDIAKRTYREFEKYDLLTPEKIERAGWDRLVEVLDSGGYARYDFSTATKLLEIMKHLKDSEFLKRLYEGVKDSKDLEDKLTKFKGIGPVTVNIFLRELRKVWKKADPEVSKFAKLAGKNLGIDLGKFNRNSKDFVRLECALLRIGKNFCRKRKCEECGFKAHCKKFR